MKLKDKSVVVTGASSGMGRAITELFVKEGANVIAVDVNDKNFAELEEALKNESGKVITLKGDVSSQEDDEKAIDLAVKEFGRLDILVNNAGIMDDFSPVGEVENDRLERIFNINVYGPIYLMRKAVQVFLEQKDGGNIINVASVGGLSTVAGAIYCASKSALLSLTRNTAFMYSKDNIRVNSIAPGSIATNISSSMGNVNSEGYQKLAPNFSQMPEAGTSEDIAKAALFLASDDSKYVNGDVLIVDGGFMAR